MMIVGGHSGIGLIAARELSGTKAYPFITTVSKRGRPEGLGPGSALLEAMVQGDTQHYMAKCDVEDPVAFNDLWEWGPSSQPKLPPGFLALDRMIAGIKAHMDTSSHQLLQGFISLLQEILGTLQGSSKLVKDKLVSEKSKGGHELLEQSLLLLEERDAEVTELLADVHTKANDRKMSSTHDEDVAAANRVLENFKQTWSSTASIFRL